MATLDYVDVPSYATRIVSEPPAEKKNPQPPPKIVTSLPPQDDSVSSPANPMTPTGRSTFGNLPAMLLASTLQLPAGAAPGNPRNSTQLLSTRDPLSVPIMTVNFRRFIAKIGPMFWLQDRIEEILMWRKGWKVTAMWMAVYAFLCYFPRLLLLVPHAIILAVLIVGHPSRRPDASSDPTVLLPPPKANAREGSTEWLANIQGVQNLMGAVSDGHDTVFPLVPHLTYSTPYTQHIFILTIITFIIALPLLPLVPLRPLFLAVGLLPFVLTHPFSQRTLPAVIDALPIRRLYTWVARITDDDRLKDYHWRSQLREVELFENERWNTATDAQSGSWSKTFLKTGERVAWTRGRDGWSGVTSDGSGDVSSNLTFALEPGWAFVETEDWRADIEGQWSAVGADKDGWVYTNDAWLDPHSAPLDDWKTAGGLTRRRRWTRRIYLHRSP
ncbi:hypothetical protein EVG20_g5807 [Dentipellis fragilis]|uniref:TECPR1-like DysF domain-containing protein n=1 Tax=Dentipellis fragilis TaxID=205917 RepID=A0A4Y9YSV4_9AGAM|nr:hypothetical protein EVG20_g5807 [Dentipellis fragilis]